MDIPVPPVFLYERDFNSYEVMDGQQRITAIKDFYDNGFALKGLETWPELNGRSYKGLPEKIKAGIDRRSITSIVLLKESTGSEEEASILRETVFERLNTGGIKLERQEIRNALYRGLFNDAVDALSRWDLFRTVWDLPLYVPQEIDTNRELVEDPFFSKMSDKEMILRFFALRHVEHYKGGMQAFLDLYMRKAMKFQPEGVDFLHDLYMDTLILADGLYGDLLFRAFSPEADEWDGKPHKAFYDAVMIGLQPFLRYRNLLYAQRETIITATEMLFSRYPLGTFTGRGNTKSDIQERISLFSNMIREAIA